MSDDLRLPIRALRFEMLFEDREAIVEFLNCPLFLAMANEVDRREKRARHAGARAAARRPTPVATRTLTAADRARIAHLVSSTRVSLSLRQRDLAEALSLNRGTVILIENASENASAEACWRAEAWARAERNDQEPPGPPPTGEHGPATQATREGPAKAGRENESTKAPTSDEASQDPELSPEPGPAAQAATTPRATEDGARGEVAGATREGEGGRKAPLPDASRVSDEERRRIATIVKAARLARRMTQAAVAAETRATDFTISMIERAQNGVGRERCEQLLSWARAPHPRDGQGDSPAAFSVTTKADRQRIAKIVREARARAGLSQFELGKQLGCNQTAISTAERGFLASAETLAKLEAWARSAPAAPAAPAPPPAKARSATPTPKKPDAAATPPTKRATASPMPPEPATAPPRTAAARASTSVRFEDLRPLKPGAVKMRRPTRQQGGDVRPWRPASEPAIPRALPADMDLRWCAPYNAKLVEAHCKANRKRARAGDPARDHCKGCKGLVPLDQRPRAA